MHWLLQDLPQTVSRSESKWSNMITAGNVVRHELIGLTAEVVKSHNSAGLKGKIVDESYKTLVIGGKRVFKDAVTITLTLPSKQPKSSEARLGTAKQNVSPVKVEVDGQLLVARPWDRIKKKFPKW